MALKNRILSNEKITMIAKDFIITETDQARLVIYFGNNTNDYFGGITMTNNYFDGVLRRWQINGPMKRPGDRAFKYMFGIKVH